MCEMCIFYDPLLKSLLLVRNEHPQMLYSVSIGGGGGGVGDWEQSVGVVWEVVPVYLCVCWS